MEPAFPSAAAGSPPGCLSEVVIGHEGFTVEHIMEEFIRTLNVQMLNKWPVVLWSANLWTLSEVGAAALALVKVPMLTFPAHLLSLTC